MSNVATLAELDAIPAFDNCQFHFDFFAQGGTRIVRVTDRKSKRSIQLVDRKENLAAIEAWMEEQKKTEKQ